MTVPVALHATTLFEVEADCGHRGHDSEATARLTRRWDTHRVQRVLSRLWAP
jgi:hypothetical protein